MMEKQKNFSFSESFFFLSLSYKCIYQKAYNHHALHKAKSFSGKCSQIPKLMNDICQFQNPKLIGFFKDMKSGLLPEN